MKSVKSERLKKLEVELQDLEQWLKLGLVPKKDQEKHKEEIEAVKEKIEEEKERLQILKESGEVEEYTAPKRGAQRSGYSEMPTIPDIDMQDTVGGFESDTESEDTQSYAEKSEATEGESEEEEEEDDDYVEEESYFSDKNRWKRGGIVDPDANDW